MLSGGGASPHSGAVWAVGQWGTRAGRLVVRRARTSENALEGSVSGAQRQVRSQHSSDEVSVAINVASAVVCARLSALPRRLCACGQGEGPAPPEELEVKFIFESCHP